MKKLILGIFTAFLFVNIVFAQDNGLKLTKAEILEAQQLAARFYNRLAQTQDVEPLIKEFFIKDFVKKFRDIDDVSEKTLRNKSSKDILQCYANLINYFFLYLRSYKHLESQFGENSEKKADLLINDELQKFLGTNSDLLKFRNFNFEPILSIIEIVNLKKFHRELFKVEKFNQALKKIELKFRNESVKANPKSKLSYALDDFEVSIDVGDNQSFHFHKETRFYNIYESKTYMTFLLVKQNGRMKIVMFLPNLD